MNFETKTIKEEEPFAYMNNELTEQNGPINKIPLEILQQIFSLIDKKDFKNVILVNSNWEENIKKIFINQQSKLIKNVVNVVLSFSKGKVQSDELMHLISQLEVGFICLNLSEYKIRLNSLIKCVRNLLVGLNASELERLNDVLGKLEMPVHLNFLIKLSDDLCSIYKKFDAAKNADAYTKSEILLKGVTELLEIDCVDKAIEIATKISSEWNGMMAFKKIAFYFGEKELFSHAFNFLHTLKTLPKDSFLSQIMTQYVNKVGCDKSFEMIDALLNDDECRNKAKYYIIRRAIIKDVDSFDFVDLASDSFCQKIIGWADSITDLWCQSEVYTHLAIFLMEKKHFKVALDVVSKIQPDSGVDSAGLSLSINSFIYINDILEREGYERALEEANLITDSDVKDRLIQYIIKETMSPKKTSF